MDIKFDSVNFTYPESDRPVFTGLNAVVPPGVVSLVGENGVGKSTFMLLAAGRLLPDSGTVSLNGTDTRTYGNDEEKLNLDASFLYQNMEFETDDKVGDLLLYVLASGRHGENRIDLFEDCKREFELEKILAKPIGKISKGEMQRAILAFSLLYGSTMVFMDEPVFALEDRQKKQALAYLGAYAEKEGRSIYFSAHELELSLRYSKTTLLFSKKPFNLEIGPSEELLTPEKLEKAFGVPYTLLHHKETLHRKHLEELDWLAKGKGESDLPV